MIMRIPLKHLATITIGLIVVSTLAAQDKDKKDTSDQKDQKEKLITIRTVDGKITHIDAMDKAIHLQVGKQNLKIMTIDDVKVRTINPPVQYDDKGKKKVYTAKEKKELKGDPKLPGYTAGFEDLKVNQVVEVTLVRKKTDKDPKQLLTSMIVIGGQAN
jgi:hypothetical protein